jgi:lysozyme family protein
MPTLTAALRSEYQMLFETCRLKPGNANTVKDIAEKILANKARYEAVAVVAGVPWFFVGITHYLECNLSFSKHLHNGDPLNAKTIHVPAGRPLSKTWTWETSAMDAIGIEKSNKPSLLWTDWTIAGTLFKLEAYNGFGYRDYHAMNTPYLWSFSQHYKTGKYIEVMVNGKPVVQWRPELVSQQLGSACILRYLANKNTISFPTDSKVVSDYSALAFQAEYAPSKFNDVAHFMQTYLNATYDAGLEQDGKAGSISSDILYAHTGKHLVNDPRFKK